MGKFKRIATVLAVSGCMVTGAAKAVDTTTTFLVTMTVTSNCIVAATPLAFAGVGVLTANTDAQSTVTATCTPGTSFDVGLDDGANASGSQRRMVFGGSNFINYELYTDSGRTTRWDDIGGTTTQGDNGSDLDGIVIYDVYGRVPVQSSQAAGAYTDTITVTLSF